MFNFQASFKGSFAANATALVKDNVLLTKGVPMCGGASVHAVAMAAGGQCT